jgi:hypothetical protein
MSNPSISVRASVNKLSSIDALVSNTTDKRGTRCRKLGNITSGEQYALRLGRW